MTSTTTHQTTESSFELCAEDLYKDIHKGIRAELFSVTLNAGRIDPSSTAAVADVAAHVRSVIWLLESHAEHEDTWVQPAVELHLPELADRIAVEHATYEHRTEWLLELATDAVDAPLVDRRRRVHQLYLELASFSGEYLGHQHFEERVLMPALEAAIGTEACVGIHQDLVGSIPPPDMGRSLAVMFPAMNIDDRAGLLGGVRAGAPAEVYDGILGLARSVLAPEDGDALVARLG